MSSPISAFMPIPLAVMPPFMAYQSILIGDAFGRGYQFGKRKISELSNEQIKKMSIDDVFRDASVDYLRMIPTVKQAMAQSLDLQVFIVKELIKIIPAMTSMFSKEAPPIISKAVDTAVQQGFGLKQLADAIAGLGHVASSAILPEASAAHEPPVITSRFDTGDTGKRINKSPTKFTSHETRPTNVGLQKTVPVQRSEQNFRAAFKQTTKNIEQGIRTLKALEKHKMKQKTGSARTQVNRQIQQVRQNNSKHIQAQARLANDYKLFYGKTLK